MKKFLALILCTLAIALGGCSEKTDTSTPQKSTEETFTVDGLCLVEKNGKILIYSEKYGVISLSNGTGDDDAFESLSTGDKISVECGLIQETYPANATISSIEVISQGKFEDVPEDVLKSLEDLNWEIVR